jgi:hypothetical protein
MGGGSSLSPQVGDGQDFEDMRRTAAAIGISPKAPGLWEGWSSLSGAVRARLVELIQESPHKNAYVFMAILIRTSQAGNTDFAVAFSEWVKDHTLQYYSSPILEISILTAASRIFSTLKDKYPALQDQQECSLWNVKGRIYSGLNYFCETDRSRVTDWVIESVNREFVDRTPDCRDIDFAILRAFESIPGGFNSEPSRIISILETYYPCLKPNSKEDFSNTKLFKIIQKGLCQIRELDERIKKGNELIQAMSDGLLEATDYYALCDFACRFFNLRETSEIIATLQSTYPCLKPDPKRKLFPITALREILDKGLRQIPESEERTRKSGQFIQAIEKEFSDTAVYAELYFFACRFFGVDSRD